jgi:protein TonB
LIPAATLVKQPDESQPTLPGTTAKPAAQAALSPVTDASSPLPKPRPEAAKPAVKAKPKAVGNSDQNREKGVASGQVTGESATAKGKASAQAGDGGKAAASYASSVLRKISKTRKAKSPGKGRVVISFVVAENGALQATRVAKSSGNAKLDQVALDHIRRAAPFPPPPPSAKRNFAFEFIGTN